MSGDGSRSVRQDVLGTSTSGSWRRKLASAKDPQFGRPIWSLVTRDSPIVGAIWRYRSGTGWLRRIPTVRLGTSTLSSSCRTRMGAPLSAIKRSFRLAISAAAAAVMAVGLTSCWLGSSTPKFTPPMIWDTDMSYLPEGRIPDRVMVELRHDNEVRLTNFPRGRSVEGDDGYFCIAGEVGERYTGDATWEARNGESFFVQFEDSKILISGSSRFGEVD